jgi:hypothetical protein
MVPSNNPKLGLKEVACCSDILIGFSDRLICQDK